MTAGNKNSGEEAGIRMVCQNRKARHLYHLLEEYEAGLVLTGTEVKSLRDGHASLPESYAVIRDGELFLVDCHISEYSAGNRYNHNPMRERKLLLSRREIRRLQGKVLEKGLTLIPLSIYFRGGWAKVKLALAKGKKLYDKREDIKKREADREAERAMSRHKEY
jgi:SsrA-binding protein